MFFKKNSIETFLIVGLGNPGPAYAKSRHNAGFLALEGLSRALGLSLQKKRGNALIAEGKRGGRRIVLAKPETFMNNSGKAIAALKSWYKLDNAHIIVIYDDIDLPCGVLRVRMKGGPGTHNGMRSITACLGGAQDFPRVRVGVGQPPQGMDLADFVLSMPRGEDWAAFEAAFSRAGEAALCWVDDGIDKAMNAFNR